MSELLSASLEHLVRRHPAGTVLFREGDAGNSMYVIRAGRVNIARRISDAEITLALLGPGEFFGEMALLEGLPRSAGATVVEDADLIEVDGDTFETLVRKNGEIAVRLLRRLSSRLREADRQIQALMSRSGSARVLSLVRNLAEPDRQGRRVLPHDLTPDALMARVGLSHAEAGRVKKQFVRIGLLVPLASDQWALGPDELVNDFLRYIELQEEHDPLDVHELAELAGLKDEDADAIARRVLRARLSDARRGARHLLDGDSYATYLALKQRFEYED